MRNDDNMVTAAVLALEMVDAGQRCGNGEIFSDSVVALLRRIDHDAEFESP